MFAGGEARLLKDLGLDSKSGDITTQGTDGPEGGIRWNFLRCFAFLLSFSVLVLGPLEGNIPVCRALIFPVVIFLFTLLANAFFGSTS
jgi:hypothetical protein